jgi:NADH-quinone oxidoreductase subunit M
MLYERYHTREIAQFGGLSRRTPWLAFFFVFFTFSSIGLPGLNGFAGEFLILLGMFQRAWMGTSTVLRVEFTAIASIAVLGVVLGAWYMLFLVQRVFFGPLKEPGGHGPGTHAGGHDDHASPAGHDARGHDAAVALPPGVSDMSFREGMALMPLVVFMLWIGLWPQFFLDRMSGTVDELTKVATQQFDEKYGPAVIPTAVAELVGPTAVAATGEATPPARQTIGSEKTIAEIGPGPLTIGRADSAPLPAEELTRAN